jgi:MinD-like ATPase involved in chromosome partitioning or flagellar assembly
VEQLLGRAPDLLVGSDRAIPRALTAGEPIVIADPKSKAARSYAQLAQRCLSATARRAEPAQVQVMSSSNGTRRRRLLRKAS